MKNNSLICEADTNINLNKNVKENSENTDVFDSQFLLSTFNILNHSAEELQESFPYYKQINHGRKFLKKLLLEIQKIFDKFIKECLVKDLQEVIVQKTKNNTIQIKILEDFQTSQEAQVQQISFENIKKIFAVQYEKLFDKVNNNTYVFYHQFIIDIQDMIYNVIKDNQNLDLFQFYNQVIQLLDLNKQNYVESKKQDFDFLIKNWIKLKEKVSVFPSYPLNPRFFNEITKFPSVLQNSSLNKNDIFNIEKILFSEIKPQCNKDCVCCKNNVKMGQMSESSIEHYTFQSDCNDITNKIECTTECCSEINCKNKQIQNLNTIEQKKKVKMQIVWGVDGYTRKNLGYLLPDIFNSKQKDAILNKIIKNINHVGIEAWNITKTLDYLLETINYNQLNYFQNEKFDEQKFLDKSELYKKKNLRFEYQDSLQFVDINIEQEKFAYQILKTYSTIKQLRVGLQVHSKGLGGICNTKEGIQKNTLIEQYQGEIYPIFYWYIKQSALKKFIQMLKKNTIENCDDYKDGYLADFFNIQVEKDKKEPKGRSIFLVDPLYYGNFASRLSHSCNPNCWVIPVISNGQYSISMYAVKNIAPGEELTFDYCSSTESLEEHRKSICLCGDQICKFFYLASSQKHEEFRQKNISVLLLDYQGESFLKFNALLLESQSQSMRKKQINMLQKYSFGDDTFKICPQWVRIWASYVLEDIEIENKELIKEFSKKAKDNTIRKDIQFEIDTLKTQRITDLVITIDKINFFCMNQKRKTVESPLTFLTDDKYQNFLYLLIKNIKKSNFVEDQYILQLMDKTLQQKISQTLKNKFPFIQQDKFKGHELTLQVKYIFLLISKYILKNFPSQIEVSDQFYFMAFTLRYFQSEKYDSYCIDVDIKKCDLVNPGNTLIHDDKPQEEQITDLNKVVNVVKMQFKKGI